MPRSTPIAVYALCICACVVSIAIQRFVRWRHNRSFDPAERRCSCCSYRITPSSTSYICPECGSNLRIMGVTGLDTAPMSFGGAWYLLILLTAVPAGLLLSLGIEQIQPFGWRFQAGRMVEIRELNQSGAPLGYPSGLWVEAVGEGRGSRRVLQYITVYGGGQKELRVLPQRWVLHFNSIYTHVAEVRYTPAIAQRYVNDSFPTAAEVERIRLAAEVDRIIRELAAGGLPNQDDPVGAGTTSRQSLDESVMLRIRVVVIPLFVLSALVAVSVVRRRVKRTLRERWREDFQKLRSEREPVLK